MQVRCRWECFIAWALLAAIGSASVRAQQTNVVALKKLSLDELLSLEVTTVSRGESTVRQSPAAIFVITRQDIRRSGVTEIAELFRMVPGMQVARIDNNKWAVSVRGFNDRFNGKLLVQVDGRTVYNPLSSGVFWDAVDYPLQDIERIEIIRGPGASTWGANAVNGVINILTRSAADTHGVEVSGGGGAEERVFGTVRVGGQAHGSDYRVYAKAFDRNPQQSVGGGEAPDAWTGASGGFRVDRPLSDHNSLTVQGDFLSSTAQRKDFRPMPVVPFSLINVEDETTHDGNVLARLRHQSGERSGWAVQVYWDRFDREGTEGFVDLRWDTFDLDFQRQLTPAGRHAVTFGAGYRYIDAVLGPSTHDNGFAVSFDPEDRHPQLYTAFLQDEIVLMPDSWLLTLGSKFEHNDHTGFEWQPGARLLWTPTPKRSVWAAASRALRTPNLSEDAIGSRQLPSFPPALSGSPLFVRLSDSPNFESEELIAYELGFRTQASDALSFDTAAFFNHYDRLRTAVPGTVTPGEVPGTFDLPLTFQNRMKAETYGVELAATWQPTNAWRVYGAWSFLKMNLRADSTLPPGVIASAEAPERQNPQQQLYLQSNWMLHANLELGVTGRYVDRLAAFTPVVDSYVAVDARLAWHPAALEQVEFELVGRNLFDAAHPESGTAPLLASLLVEIERAVYGVVRVTW